MNVHDPGPELLRLVELALEGEEVVIHVGDLRAARVVPYAARRRTPGSGRGQVWMAPDFDATPEEILRALGPRRRR